MQEYFFTYVLVEYHALTRTEYARIFIIVISGVLYPSPLILPFYN